MSYYSNRRTFSQEFRLLGDHCSQSSGAEGSGSMLLAADAPAAADADALRQAFLEPPEAAWPWVYWMVTDGMLTKEGITADLEAMRRVGIRGLIYMENDLYIPKGPVRFMTSRVAGDDSARGEGSHAPGNHDRHERRWRLFRQRRPLDYARALHADAHLERDDAGGPQCLRRAASSAQDGARLLPRHCRAGISHAGRGIRSHGGALAQHHLWP